MQLIRVEPVISPLQQEHLTLIFSSPLLLKSSSYLLPFPLKIIRRKFPFLIYKKRLLFICFLCYNHLVNYIIYLYQVYYYYVRARCRGQNTFIQTK